MSGRIQGPDYAVQNCGYETPCWISVRAKLPWGVAQIRRNGKNVSVHRYYYEREHGLIPLGMHLHHLCKQPACQRLSHLVLLTPAEHRARHGGLDDETRAALIEAGKDPKRKYKDIAAEFGVSRPTVSTIMRAHGVQRYKK